MAEQFTPADVVGNVFGGGATSGGDIGGLLAMIAILVFFLLIVGVVLGYLFWYMQFKHKVLIFEVYSGGVRFIQDKARPIKTKGMSKLELFKGKTTLQLPPNYNSKYWHGKNQAYIVHKENDMFRFHIQYEIDKSSLKVLPQEVTEFIVKEIEENNQRYGVKEFWEQYGNLITSVGFTIMFFGMMLILIDKFGELAGQLNSIAGNIGEMLKTAVGEAPK